MQSRSRLTDGTSVPGVFHRRKKMHKFSYKQMRVRERSLITSVMAKTYRACIYCLHAVQASVWCMTRATGCLPCLHFCLFDFRPVTSELSHATACHDSASQTAVRVDTLYTYPAVAHSAAGCSRKTFTLLSSYFNNQPPGSQQPPCCSYGSTPMHGRCRPLNTPVEGASQAP